MWSKVWVEPGVWQLCWSGVKVAELVWCVTPEHEHVAMDRIIEALARPAAECAPALWPVWRARRKSPQTFWGERPQVIEVQVGTDQFPDALVVWWYPVNGGEVRGIGNWSQRIVDALNAGHGHLLVQLQPPGRPPPLSGPLEHEPAA